MAKRGQGPGVGMTGKHQIPRVHRQTLIEMNVPVFTARRDAAHDRALSLLRLDLPLADRKTRQKLYAECDRLLGDALIFTQRSHIHRDTPLARYLTILQETVHVCRTHLTHSEHLMRETREISKMTGVAVPPAMEAGDALSNSELQMLAFIEDLLHFGEPLLKQDSQTHQGTFSDDDRRRFNTARAEYDHYYWKGNAPPEATECAP